MSFNVVIFDAGLTLLGPKPSVMKVFARVVRDLGLTLEDDYAESCEYVYLDAYERENSKNPLFWCSESQCHASWTRVYQKMAVVMGFEAQRAEIAKLMIERFTGSQHWVPYADVLPCLKELRAAGATLGIVSNWNVDLPHILEERGISEYFSCVTISSMFGVAKPHVEIFQEHLCKLGVDAASCLYVGDSISSDVLPAFQAGMTGVLLDRDYRYDERNCDFMVIHSLADLPQLL